MLGSPVVFSRCRGNSVAWPILPLDEELLNLGTVQMNMGRPKHKFTS
uniref:Uncharacterized protein n=1 Tax=Picea sitchensis TaxID=3332 RepID=D5A9G2_PICSI|nr:unknown [Picea sitchensis]